GERRPKTARAARTNRPLELPAALRGKGQTPEGRRRRDLCRHYGQRLGAERLADEATRAPAQPHLVDARAGAHPRCAGGAAAASSHLATYVAGAARVAGRAWLERSGTKQWRDARAGAARRRSR